MAAVWCRNQDEVGRFFDMCIAFRDLWGVQEKAGEWSKDTIADDRVPANRMCAARHDRNFPVTRMILLTRIRAKVTIHHNFTFVHAAILAWPLLLKRRRMRRSWRG